MRVPLIPTALASLPLLLLLGLISIVIDHFGHDTSHLHGLGRTGPAGFRRLLGCRVPDLPVLVIGGGLDCVQLREVYRTLANLTL